ncbi:penicillin-insensitive murein endopeptidase [Beggiatoa leptomitoformis]|uniref:Penicillin-insensitive murein endopeptidase n=1 Tax=Beggiatoa leptomitoformis TaxID=288004 RepID=A0A2N9YFU2_9GAMM|nr:penicillin-insensitive murein endopeptidase [Beggiatoa leptomitoformis]ALG68320.1 penicillin-insensitive murein endopeptidase [Beggiatoa leptomitoformis]AUI69364.1 penicillin-insensitive murein endopeptidase [Beggiatoa leptomitoformis]
MIRIILHSLCLSFLCYHPNLWADNTAPTQIYGTHAAGCIKNARILPPEGEGYQAIRLSRQRNYAHPSLIYFIQTLGKQMARQQNSTLFIGDIGQEGGGAMSGHGSHQIGLDVDILFLQPANSHLLSVAEREKINPISMLTNNQTEIDTKRWRPVHDSMLQLAAENSPVERIFVNPVIKKYLCTQYPQAAWQAKIRPWWGHDGHFHVRLRCPSDSPHCVMATPLPANNGCGTELDWWFSADANKSAQQKYDKSKPKKPRVLPTECSVQ